MNDIVKVAIIALATSVVVFFGASLLVGDNQPEADSFGGGSRFPSGISADSTSPSSGEVRGTTFTSTGLATLASASITSTLGVTGELTAREGTTALTASTTITAADSGKTYYMGTADVDVTLPVPADGVWYRFVVSGNFATTNMTVQGPAADATDDVMFGALEVAGAVVACSAEDTISFVNTAELPGDFVEIRSDGTNWYVTGQATTSGGITCTDAD